MIQHFIIRSTRWSYMDCSQQLVNLATDFTYILQLKQNDASVKVLKGKDPVYMTEMYQYTQRTPEIGVK